MGLGVIGFVTGTSWFGSQPQPHRIAKKPTPLALTKGEQRKNEERIVATFRDKKDPSSQDLVGQAQLCLAYLDAESHDFESSRKRLLQTAKLKGTGQMGADFGGINDQAAYQAVVCLVAEGKKAEARTGFRKFIKDNPLSPLVYAAHKRLAKLSGMVSAPEDDQLLQVAVNLQEKNLKLEEAVCGPKTLEYMLKQGLLHASGAEHASDYHAIAKLCNTGGNGTTLEGMRLGLKALGIQCYGVDLNRQDVDKLKLPAILLDGDHYYAALERHDRSLVLFDTFLKAKRTLKLPAQDDAEFRMTFITFSAPNFDSNL